MKTYEERIKEIDDHFANVTMEEFEAGLERAGMKPYTPWENFIITVAESLHINKFLNWINNKMKW
jgi:hypothetical protein